MNQSFNGSYKALTYNQQQYSSTTSSNNQQSLEMINFKHVVLIPVGADGRYDSCPTVGDYGNPCGWELLFKILSTSW